MKSTKRSLLMSVLSLILCFTMLLGTTFAWFTDSVTSGKNQIIAGNLDVELYAGTEKVTESTKLFDDVALWEPGAYCFETFTIKNVGNLAFKYSMQINATNATEVNDHSLDEILKVKVVDTAPMSRPSYSDGSWLKGWSLNETNQPLYPAGNIPDDIDGAASEKTFTVVIYWEPTDHDNDYNMNNGNRGKPLSVDLGVTLVATQLTYEKDSFDDQYDLTAQLPVLAVFPGISKADTVNGTKTVEIEKQGAIKKATVPTKAAKTTFDALENQISDAYQGAIYSKDLTLTLNVAETGKEEKGDASLGFVDTTIDLDISMGAVMTVTNAATGEVVETKKNDDVKKLDEYSVIQMQIGAGYTSVTVKHEGKDMEELAGVSSPVSEAFALIGGYHYSKSDGILTLKTKTFSPYEVTVKTDCTGIELNKSEAALASGSEETLLVTLLPKEAQLTADQVKKYVQWSSSDEDVCTVDETGKLTGVGEGTATVTAALKSNSNIKATCAVSVKEYLCEIVDKAKYDSLDVALDEAEDGDTVRLLKDASRSSTITITKNIDFDLGGKTLNTTATYAIDVNCAMGKIINGTIEATGTYGIYVGKSADASIEELNVDVSNCAYPLYVGSADFHGTIKKISGGSYIGKASGSPLNYGLQVGSKGTVTEISGGKFQGTGGAFYNYGTISKISGGVFCPKRLYKLNTLSTTLMSGGDETTFRTVFFFKNKPESVTGGTWAFAGRSQVWGTGEVKDPLVLDEGYTFVQGDLIEEISNVDFLVQFSSSAGGQKINMNGEYYWYNVVPTQD